jgi:hypothetical protein
MVSGLQFATEKKRKASSHEFDYLLIFVISFPITIGSSDSSDLKRTHTCKAHHLPDFYMWFSRRSASFGEESASSCKKPFIGEPGMQESHSPKRQKCFQFASGICFVFGQFGLERF